MPSSESSSSKEVDLPFNSDEDDPPDPILALYKKLCPGGFQRGDEMTEEATDSDANAETNSGSSTGFKPTK